MSQNNTNTKNNTKLYDSKDSRSQTRCPFIGGPPNSKAGPCEETGEFYDINLSQKPVKTDQYFNTFGAGGGSYCQKNK